MTAKQIKNIGLGRGLDAIFEAESSFPEKQTSADKDVSNVEEIDINSIIPNPKQPRTMFDEEALAELADSIRTLGLIQPVTVKKDGDSYTIISGERRWRASKMAGLKTIPTYVREADDQLLHEMSLVENIQRQDLNAMEIAISLQRLMDECNVTQDTVASRVGKKRSTVANYLRLLTLPMEVQSALKQDLISMGHAKAIASAPTELRVEMLKKTIKKGLSVRQAEELVRKLGQEPTANNATVEDEELPENYTHLVEQIAKSLSDDVKIKKNRTGGGKIIIGFASDEDISRILLKLQDL